MEGRTLIPDAETLHGGSAEAFDREAALSRLEGDLNLLVELAVLFLSSAPAQLAEIREAIEESDAEGLRVAAHTLKGAAGNFGATLVVEAARQLETLGRKRDLGAAGSALAVLESAMGRLSQALRALACEASRSSGCRM